MNQNVPGQTTVYVSFLYGLELACQKAKKSLQRFSEKSGNYRPGIRKPQIRSLTSTDVENCKGPCEGPAQLQKKFPFSSIL